MWQKTPYTRKPSPLLVFVWFRMFVTS